MGAFPQDRQPLNGQVGLDMIENVRMWAQKRRQTTGREHLYRRPTCAFNRATSPSIIAT